MAKLFHVGDRTLASDELVPLLARYRMIPQFLCEVIIDQAIASITCTVEETLQVRENFYQAWGLCSDMQRQLWRSSYDLTEDDVDLLATRPLRVEKFKRITWGSTLQSYFLKCKHNLDQVVYSLIQVSDRGLADELYFRIWEGEASFSSLAPAYTEGPESSTGGLIGPVELGQLPTPLAEVLYSSPIGEVQLPERIGQRYMVVRVERFIPAQFDDPTCQRLLDERFEAWFQTQIQRLSPTEKAWLGAFN